MPRHNVFTEIDARSYDAIVRRGYLSEVLLALLVDPLEADDMADSIKSATGTVIELKLNGRVFEAPIDLSDFQTLPSKHAFEKLKITLSQWAMTTERADIAVKTLTMWNGRFGVWCACAVAREALRFIPEGDLRPLRAIETTEAWVRGMVTAAQVDSAAAAANAAAARDAATFVASGARASAARAAACAAEAAYYDAAYFDAADVYDAAYAAARAAAFAAAEYAAARAAARAAPPYADEYRAAGDAELIRLRAFVANACLTFPG